MNHLCFGPPTTQNSTPNMIKRPIKTNVKWVPGSLYMEHSSHTLARPSPSCHSSAAHWFQPGMPAWPPQSGVGTKARTRQQRLKSHDQTLLVHSRKLTWTLTVWLPGRWFSSTNPSGFQGPWDRLPGCKPFGSTIYVSRFFRALV